MSQRLRREGSGLLQFRSKAIQYRLHAAKLPTGDREANAEVDRRRSGQSGAEIGNTPGEPGGPIPDAAGPDPHFRHGFIGLSMGKPVRIADIPRLAQSVQRPSRHEHESPQPPSLS